MPEKKMIVSSGFCTVLTLSGLQQAQRAMIQLKITTFSAVADPGGGGGGRGRAPPVPAKKKKKKEEEENEKKIGPGIRQVRPPQHDV